MIRFGLPVREDRLHVRAAVVLALDQLRRVADRLLLLVDLCDVGAHHLRRDLQVADRVVVERLGIRLPDADGVRHQLAHRGLEVVVADHAARDPGRPGSHTRLVEDHDVSAVSLAPGLELLRQVPCRGEAVDARADHDVPRVLRERHLRTAFRGSGSEGSYDLAVHTQNSVPCGSDIVVHRLPPSAVSSIVHSTVAPSARSRATSASTSSTRRSRWTAFLPGRDGVHALDHDGRAACHRRAEPAPRTARAPICSGSRAPPARTPPRRVRRPHRS